jgi:hypothetical protein
MSTVYEWFGLKTTRTVFAGLASKLVATVSSGLAPKTDAIVFTGLVSKPVAMVFSNLALKLVTMVSPGLASKSAVSLLVEPQNQGCGGFLGLGLKTSSSGLVIWASNHHDGFLVWASKPSRLRFVAPQNRRREVDAGHASRSSGLLDVKASLARVSQSGLKTAGGMTMGGARGIIVEVASETS